MILIVDDEPSALVLLDMTLRQGRYSVARASSGREALRILQSQEFPIGMVISDISMPGLDGRELLFQMRSDPRLASIPVIMCTSQNDRATVVELISQGVRDYIVKPIVPPVVLAKVRSVLAADGPVIESREETVTRLGLGQLQYVPLVRVTIDALDAIAADLSAALRVSNAAAAGEASQRVPEQASLFGARRTADAAEQVRCAATDLDVLRLAGALMTELGKFRAALEQASVVRRGADGGGA